MDSNFCVPSRDTVHYPLRELVVWQDRLNAVADVGTWELFDLTETIRHVFRELLVIHGEFQNVVYRQKFKLGNVDDLDILARDML